MKAGEVSLSLGLSGVTGGGSLVAGKSPSSISDLPSATDSEDGGQRTEYGVDRRICNFGGGIQNSCSLAQLSGWCEKRFGARKVESDPKPRPYDLPWVVLDSSRAKKLWDWEVKTSLEQIFSEIADS